jgi:serine/threonine protein kinase/tetratricopeptide (TPR) repeat protein
MSGLFERARLALRDHYSIDREIGRGAAAVVFQAEDRKHHRLVAIKVLRPEVAAEIGVERFVREIETVARLAHPHILPLFDSGEADGLPYFVMPFVPGESLRDRILREQQLPVEDAMEIARNVASALGYAHSHGIVHRDIKPANILLAGGHAIVADFGVARAISAAIDGDIERQGEVFGTPLYMSPEQLTGASRLDGRSDLYSLGCVLYEMLAGQPPFHGKTVDEVRAQHLLDPPPSLTSLGRDIPSEVDETVRRLLAKVPADRFATAQQLADGLPVIARPSPRRTRAVSRLPQEQRRQRTRWITGVVAGALVLGITWRAVISAVPPPDPNRYVVLSTTPLGGQDSRYVGALRDELIRWRGIGVARELEVLEVIQRDGAPEKPEDALSLARSTRAGRLVRLEQQARGDSLVFGIALYDAQRPGRELLYESFACPIEGSECSQHLRAVAWRLLLGPGFESVRLPGGPGTNSVSAFRAFAAGMLAYADWRLSDADSLLEVAVAADPSFADAHFQLGEIRWWRRRPRLEWQDQLRSALAVPGLGQRSTTMALGLLALADGKDLDACKQFDSLIARDSLDFAAWFGRGDCLRADKQVLRDPKSASGWRFRSSYDAAIRSYRRALGLAPGVHRVFGERAYAEVAGLLYTAEYVYRPGYLDRTDSIAFAAWPALDADTTVFVPWPFVQAMSMAPETRSPTQMRAILRNRSLMADITAEWIRAFPRSAEAHLARAIALEVLREGGQESGWGEALEQAATARALATTATLRTEAATTEVRLRLKGEDYAGAARLADSLVAAASSPDTASARRLASAAALTGHISKAVTLAAAGAENFMRIGAEGQLLILPVPASEAAFALLVYSAFGVPVDSIAALERRVDERVTGFMQAGLLAAARQEATDRPAALAFATAGMRPAHQNAGSPVPWLAIQAAVARGDFAAVRASLDAIQVNRGGTRLSNYPIDAAFLEVQLRLAIGDTATAIRRLSISLGSLGGFGPDLLSSEVEGALPQMAILGRAMTLRADLAARDGDTETARRWARAAATLWANADEPLQPTVARMRALAGISSAPAR